MELHFGGAVTGAQRFARPGLEQRLAHLVRTGNGVKMFGLRRTGKSTFLKVIAETMRREEWIVVEIDAQGMHAVDQLLWKILHALFQARSGWGNRLAAAFSGGQVPATLQTALDVVRAGKAPDKDVANTIEAYRPMLSNLIVGLLEEERDKAGTKILLVIDELPFLVENMIRADAKSGVVRVDELLAALREWRKAGMRMVLAGSIGLIGLARKYGFRSDHLNDLARFDVPELTDQEAIALIGAATTGTSVAGAVWSQEHTDALMREVGATYPSFLVKSLQTLLPSTPTDRIPEVFRTEIRPEFHETFFEQFGRRFKLYGEIGTEFQSRTMRPLLRAILPNDGETFDLPEIEGVDAFARQEALDLLVEDGFVASSQDPDGRQSWRPASRLVRQWWRRLDR